MAIEKKSLISKNSKTVSTKNNVKATPSKLRTAVQMASLQTAVAFTTAKSKY